MIVSIGSAGYACGFTIVVDVIIINTKEGELYDVYQAL